MDELIGYAAVALVATAWLSWLFAAWCALHSWWTLSRGDTDQWEATLAAAALPFAFAFALERAVRMAELVK
jgi:hypothetical protein